MPFLLRESSSVDSDITELYHSTAQPSPGFDLESDSLRSGVSNPAGSSKYWTPEVRFPSEDPPNLARLQDTEENGESVEIAEIPAKGEEIRRLECVQPPLLLFPRSSYQGYIPPLPRIVEAVVLEDVLASIHANIRDC
jgi:hypothetical protein